MSTRLLALDVETTGLDPAKDRVIEIGWVLWDVERKAALRMGGGLVEGVTVSPEISELTGILPEDVREFGEPIEGLFSEITRDAHGVEYAVAHNARFDRAFLEAEAKRVGRQRLFESLTWLDTMTDLPLPKHVKPRDLGGLCAAHGFAPLIQHRALTDALSCCRLLSQYPIDRVLYRAQSPEVIVRAVVSYDQKDLAKALRFQWQEAGGAEYPKWWVKAVKECDLHDLVDASRVAGFHAQVLGPAKEAKAA